MGLDWNQVRQELWEIQKLKKDYELLIASNLVVCDHDQGLPLLDKLEEGGDGTIDEGESILSTATKIFCKDMLPIAGVLNEHSRTAGWSRCIR